MDPNLVLALLAICIALPSALIAILELNERFKKHNADKNRNK